MLSKIRGTFLTLENSRAGHASSMTIAIDVQIKMQLVIIYAKYGLYNLNYSSGMDFQHSE